MKSSNNHCQSWQRLSRIGAKDPRPLLFRQSTVSHPKRSKTFVYLYCRPSIREHSGQIYWGILPVISTVIPHIPDETTLCRNHMAQLTLSYFVFYTHNMIFVPFLSPLWWFCDNSVVILSNTFWMKPCTSEWSIRLFSKSLIVAISHRFWQ